MKVEGIIKQVQDEQKFTNFTKRSLILETEEKYPQTLDIEFHQDRVDLLDMYKSGMRVCVHINLRGREWTNPQGEVKYFNSIVGWRIENMSANNPIQSNEVEVGKPTDYADDNEDDSLPF